MTGSAAAAGDSLERAKLAQFPCRSIRSRSNEYVLLYEVMLACAVLVLLGVVARSIQPVPDGWALARSLVVVALAVWWGRSLYGRWRLEMRRRRPGEETAGNRMKDQPVLIIGLPGDDSCQGKKTATLPASGAAFRLVTAVVAAPGGIPLNGAVGLAFLLGVFLLPELARRNVGWPIVSLTAVAAFLSLVLAGVLNGRCVRIGPEGVSVGRLWQGQDRYDRTGIVPWQRRLVLLDFRDYVAMVIDPSTGDVLLDASFRLVPGRRRVMQALLRAVAESAGGRPARA